MVKQENQPNRKSRVVIELGTETEPFLVRWSILLASYSPFESYALCTEEGWVLIDPEEPEAQAKEHLCDLISDIPIASVLTSDGHERACYMIRERWGIPVWAPVVGPSRRGIAYEGKPDHFYEANQTLPGGLRPIKLRGAWGGDHALLWHASNGQRLLFTGDILNGQVEQSLTQPDHYRYLSGLYFGARPNYIERHEDPEGLKQSLHSLFEESFDAICGAHGIPFWDDPKTAVARLLDAI